MKDKISVVLAVYNEQHYVENAIRSLLSQKQTDFSIEIIVVDGGSTDKTVEKILELQKTYPDNLKYYANEKRVAPAAFNIGIMKAEGNFVAILGAHAKYEADYLHVCYREMRDHNADGCSGRVVPVSNIESKEAELCLSIYTSPIGVSGSSFRTRKAGFATSIPYGVFKKEVFEKVGYYDERLVRNQDNDMNARIISAGYRLYITDKTKALYYPRTSFNTMLSYATKSGFWNAKSLLLKSYTLKIYHFVPFFFLIFNMSFAILLISFPFTPLAGLLIMHVLVLLLYLLLVLRETIRISFGYRSNMFLFPGAIYLFHLSYGYGTLKGFLSKG